MSTESLHLVRKVKRGDERAVDSLLAMHLPGLRGFLEKRAGDWLRNREPVSDLVQSTFREVLQDLDAFEYETEAHFKHWLYQAALRKVVDKARYHRAARRDRRREVPLEAKSPEAGASDVALPLGDDPGTPSQAAMGREDLRRVEKALQQLSREHRDVIVMARFMGLSHAEIATETGRSVGATRALLHRAMTALKGELEDEDEAPEEETG